MSGESQKYQRLDTAEVLESYFKLLGITWDFPCIITSAIFRLKFAQTGLNYDKLRWPFKAEFVTHLSSQSKPENIKKFKSEVIEWKREKFNSGAYVCSFPIATFSKCEFLEDFFINGEAEFKIFVIIL